MVEEMAPVKGIEKQGLVTILGSDTKPSASLRRTLSADMSSKKWLSQNGFFSMKKIASSYELVINRADSSSSSSESEEEYDEIRPGQDEIWRSIQIQKEQKNNQPDQIPSGKDIWDSILSQQNDQDSSKNVPYVHPLVKRSSLSQKSLEVCTENLGSETGSDGFLSEHPQRVNPCPESPEKLSKSLGDINVVKYKTVSPRPLPPPISSIGSEDGNSLRMHSHRQNGRLILELVSVPSRNCFQTQRLDGRLLLTLINPPSAQKHPSHEAAAIAQEVAALTEDEVEFQSAIEQNSKPRGAMITVHKSGLMMNKLMGLRNKINPTWSNKLDNALKLIEVGAELPLPPLPPSRIVRLIPTSPPPPTAATASVSFNAYEYFWRNKTSFITSPQCIPLKNNVHNKIFHSNGERTYEQQELVLIGSLLRGCKEQRKSLLIWEPYCIATT